MNIEIENGIPIPDTRAQSATGFTATLRKLKVGQSFVWHNAKQAQAASSFASRLNIKVAVRKIENGHRVWRVA